MEESPYPSSASIAANGRLDDELVSGPARGSINLRLRDLWAYRHLRYFVIWGEIRVRYTQGILGACPRMGVSGS